MMNETTNKCITMIQGFTETATYMHQVVHILQLDSKPRGVGTVDAWTDKDVGGSFQIASAQFAFRGSRRVALMYL